jgi:hypothetical protein
MGRSRRAKRSPAPALPYNAEVAADSVDNPYSVVGGRIPALRSIRDDPLAWLLVRQAITGPQYDAGREWQAAFEFSGIGAIAALDPLKEPVDGGRLSHHEITDRQLAAFRRLKAARDALGLEGHLVVRDVLGEGLFMTAVAARRGYAGQFGARYFGRRFRECLQTLAELWGYAPVDKPKFG